MPHFAGLLLSLTLAVAASGALAGSYEDWFAAVRSDDARAVRTLLQQGFDANAPDPAGQTGLILAVRDDAPQVATALLDHRATRIDAPNAADETALMHAAIRGRTEMAMRLLERGAQVNRSGWTPLHYAASGPEPALVALLLERGAAIDAGSPNGSTPLMMAARYGAIDAAELLLARGADAKARNERGLSAADFARGAGRDALAAKIEAAAR